MSISVHHGERGATSAKNALLQHFLTLSGQAFTTRMSEQWWPTDSGIAVTDFFLFWKSYNIVFLVKILFAGLFRSLACFVLFSLALKPMHADSIGPHAPSFKAILYSRGAHPNPPLHLQTVSVVTIKQIRPSYKVVFYWFLGWPERCSPLLSWPRWIRRTRDHHLTTRKYLAI